MVSIDCQVGEVVAVVVVLLLVAGGEMVMTNDGVVRRIGSCRITRLVMGEN